MAPALDQQRTSMIRPVRQVHYVTQLIDQASMSVLTVPAQHSKQRSLQECTVLSSASDPEFFVAVERGDESFIRVDLQCGTSNPLAKQPYPARVGRVQVVSPIALSHGKDLVPSRHRS